MTPAFVDQSLLGPEPDPGWPFKLDAFIHIARHAGDHLAQAEGPPPYEVGVDFATVGRCEFVGGLPDELCGAPEV
jgi:hypothetical protein